MTAVAKVHQHVSSGGKVGSSYAGEYLSRLCADLSSILEVDIRSPAEGGADLELPTARIVSLGLIVNELVTNAAKHGASQVTVSLEGNEVGGCTLTIADDGRGLPADFDPQASRGLGMQVVASAVSNLGGELTFATNPKSTGTVFAVRLASLD